MSLKPIINESDSLKHFINIMAINRRRCSLCDRKCNRQCIMAGVLSYIIVLYVIVYMYTNIDMRQLTQNHDTVVLPETYINDFIETVSVKSTKHYVNASKTAYNDGLVEAITARANRDRCIILAMADKSFIDMAFNLYETSFKAHKIENYLFIGIGKTTCDTLHNRSVACFYYCDDQSAEQVSAWGSADFKRKMAIRPTMILEALAANFTVVHTDVDVSFIENPFDEIKVFLSGRPKR